MHSFRTILIMLTTLPHNEPFHHQGMAEQGEIAICPSQKVDADQCAHQDYYQATIATNDTRSEASHKTPITLCGDGQAQQKETEFNFADTTILDRIPYCESFEALGVPTERLDQSEDCITPLQGEEAANSILNTTRSSPSQHRRGRNSGVIGYSPLQTVAKRWQQRQQQVTVPPSPFPSPADCMASTEKENFSRIVLHANASPANSSPSTCPSLCLQSSADSGLTDDISDAIDWAYGQGASRSPLESEESEPGVLPATNVYDEISVPQRDSAQTTRTSTESPIKETQRKLESNDIQDASVRQRSPVKTGDMHRNSHIQEQKGKQKRRSEPFKDQDTTRCSRQLSVMYQATPFDLNGVKTSDTYCPQCSDIPPKSARPARCIECLRVRNGVQRSKRASKRASKMQVAETQTNAKLPAQPQPFLQGFWKKMVPVSVKKPAGKRDKMRQWKNVLAGQLKTAFR